MFVGGRLVNVLTREIHPADILVASGRIAAVVPPGQSWKAGVEIIDAAGNLISPGFIDPHVHIESSMVTVAEYARCVVPRGTTTIAADPHEIGNVLGLPGMRLLFEEAGTVPLRVLLRVPGRIPAMPDWLETSNARLDQTETEAMFDWPEAVCLAGDISPTLILDADAEQLGKIAFSEAQRRTVSGQAPGLRGRMLNAYIAGGPQDSHVANDVDEIVDNLRLGLRTVLALRPGRRLNAAHFADLARRVREERLETRFLQLCTDDIHAHFLHQEGALDHRLRAAIAAGFDVMTAYQMVTLNVAEGLRIDRDLGSVSPGRYADLLLLSDLATVAIEQVFIGGVRVAEGTHYSGPAATFRYPAWASETIRLQRAVTDEDLPVRAPHNAPRARVRAITLGAPKRALEADLEVRAGAVLPDPAQDVAALAVIERHTGSGRIGRGFLTGLGLQRGALATSISHDAHNLFVVGCDFADIAVAANRLATIGGGYVLALDGEVIAELALPIAGLMSAAPIAAVAAAMAQIEALLTTRLGCSGSSRALMALNFVCLPNIPHVGFTDFGMLDAHTWAPLAPIVGA